MSVLDALKHPWAVPEENLKVETDDRFMRMAGALIILAAFGGFGGWAATAPLGSAVVAPGIVTVDTYRKTVQHLEGGIVKQIMVREGDLVAADQVLLRLDDTQTQAQLEIARLQYYAQIALDARLHAEQLGDGKITFPDELQNLSGDKRVVDMMRGQVVLFETRRKSRLGEISVLEQRVEQLQVQMQGQQDLADAKGRTIRSYNEQVVELRKLFEQKLVDKTRLRDYERAVSTLEGERAEALSNAAAAKVQMGEAKLAILQKQQDFQKDVAAELRDVQSKIFDLDQRVHALQDTVARTEVRATSAGRIVGLTVHNEGAVVSAGARILDIVPNDEPLVIEAQVQPSDIDRVHPGLMTDVRFSAFHDRQTPVVNGQVVMVSPDRITDPNSRQPYYLARVQVSDSGMAILKGKSLVPGMPAEVLVNTGERTALDYFIKPLIDAIARSFKER